MPNDPHDQWDDLGNLPHPVDRSEETFSYRPPERYRATPPVSDLILYAAAVCVALFILLLIVATVLIVAT